MLCAIGINKEKYPILFKYTNDVNEIVNKFDIRIGGRDTEIYNISRILCRLEKNTPVLIGEPGVGKTAIVYGIAEMINNGMLNILGNDVSIRSLNIASLFSGTSYRGDLEARIQGLIKESSELRKHVILFIDEFHMLFSSNMGMDISGVFKISITDPNCNMRFIAATTRSEYSKHIGRDEAIDRRLNIVYINELSLDDTVNTINFVKGRYEKHYGFSIEKDIIRYAAIMSKKHVGGNYPDVAFDIIDRTFSNISFRQEMKPEEIILIEKSINNMESTLNDKRQILIKKLMSDNISENDITCKVNNDKSVKMMVDNIKKMKIEIDDLNKMWSDETSLFKKIKSLKIKRDELLKQRDYKKRIYDFEAASKIMYVDLVPINSEIEKLEKSSSRFIKTSVDKDEINISISEKTGIPKSRFSVESGNTDNMKSFLLSRIVGQNNQINQICEILSSALSNFKISSGPLSVVLFVGPTGVGKTETSILITHHILGKSREPFIIDLSQYSEEHSVSSLLGSPAGYIGHDQDGLLAKAIKYNKDNVILFDEIEKAHPRVLLSLMQIMDTGYLIDRLGNKLDFTKSFIILNSNIITSCDGIDDDLDYDANVRKQIVLRGMKPELVNRVEDIVVFKKLLQRDVVKIVEIIVDLYVEKISNEHEIYIECSSKVFSYISSISYNDVYGARDVKRNIKKYLITPIVRKLCVAKFNRPLFVKIDFDNKNNCLIIDY